MEWHTHDRVYREFLMGIMHEGEPRMDRTGVGTISTFGKTMRFDLREGFPLLTTKKVHFHSVLHELIWFLSGDTNIGYLKDNNVHIWDEWADENGDLGPVYGAQWRSWGKYDRRFVEIDQIWEVFNNLKSNPFSRRHVISAWNPSELHLMALPPCHTMFQFYVSPDSNGDPKGLSLSLYQRSGDAFLGVPFNIASYALLLELFATSLGLEARHFVHQVGDAHIYNNHLDQVKAQLERSSNGPYPRVDVVKKSNVLDYVAEDIRLVDYDPHPAIKAPVAV